MEKLREALITFANSNPSLFPNHDGDFYPVLIKQRFSQLFLDFQTPNHPPYAAMIHRAIWELNEKGGSREESISKYIKQEYADLPWAHSTLLKHHLEKLCDRKEISMTHKHRYLLAGADSDPISTSKSEKVLKRKQCSESGKKNRGHLKKKQKSGPDSESSKTSNKKHKKKEKCMLGIQETNKQIIEVVQEQDQAELLDEVADDKEQTRIHGTKKSKLTRKRKSKRKSSKGIKKHKINEENHISKANSSQHNKVTESERHEQEQTSGISVNDVQEKNELHKDGERAQESQPDNSGYVDLEKIQTKQNPQLLKPEESPGSNHILHKNGKRIWTRSQLNITSKKDALATSELSKSAGYPNMQKEELHIFENLISSEEEQAMQIIEEKQGPIVVSTQMNRRTAKVRSSTEVQDPEKSEEQPQDDKSKYKRRGRHPKPREPEKNKLCNSKAEAIPKKIRQSAKKCKAGSRCPKPKRAGLRKSKSSKKKDQPKSKRQVSHKTTMRSSKKKKVSSR